MSKQNAYTSLDFEQVKKQVGEFLEYLQSLTIEKLEDEITWTSTANGGMMPTVVSSIEDKLKTAIVVLYDIILQLKVIHKNEGITPELEYFIDISRSKVSEINDYYKKRPLKEVSHRYQTVSGGVTAKGKEKILTLRCATKEHQIKTRSDVQKKVLQILPELGQLETLRKEFNQKGGGDIAPSLIGIIT